ncbi:kinase-like domain-containing protein [Thelephora terrestris]|uniref:Kinase-like domain-containing protein n=1 Tax=Thelephora terrestris TaxID=56493 RepID=A0A9P6HBI9_9AGAM|nr:kinase-like domain-containing protein [Thelephora terrestris]
MIPSDDIEDQGQSPRQTEEVKTLGGHLVERNQQPPVRSLNGEVTRDGHIAFAGGPHGAVWKGRQGKGGGEKDSADGVGEVALKDYKPWENKRSKRMRQGLEDKLLPHWAKLHHENLLPFYGIVTDIGKSFYTVSPWREKGNLLAYVKKYPHPDKHHLLRGSAAGLSYLHSMGYVHGNVKCSNVLITQEGEPQLCDFGIAALVEDANGSRNTSSGEMIRYAAPELIRDNCSTRTVSSDTYSFAMLILVCVTEEVPFLNITHDAAVVHARITNGPLLPSRPNELEGGEWVSDGLWNLMERCWSYSPGQRPTMEEIHRFFLEQT